MKGASRPSSGHGCLSTGLSDKARNLGGVLPAGEDNLPPVPRQGRAIANTIAREPASLRTGRALTGAVRRIMQLSRGKRPKSRQLAAFAILEARRSAGASSGPHSARRNPTAGRLLWKCVSI